VRYTSSWSTAKALNAKKMPPTANASFTSDGTAGTMPRGREGEGDAPEGAGERAADAPVRERVVTIASDSEARATDERTAASREARGRRR
jgi:hypothetical protein